MEKIEKIAKELELLKKENEEMKRKLSSFEKEKRKVKLEKKETTKKDEEKKEEILSTLNIIGIISIILGVLIALFFYRNFIVFIIIIVIIGVVLLEKNSLMMKITSIILITLLIISGAIYALFFHENYISSFIFTIGAILIWVLIGTTLLQKHTEKQKDNEAKNVKEKNQSFENIKEKITTKKSSFEFSIGINWFAIIGVLALVIGIGFFVKYAIDNNWIDHLSRLILGAAFGLVLIIAGKILSNNKKYEYVGRTLIGGGIAVIYFMAYASYHFEEYRNAIGMKLLTNIIMLIIITLIALIISIYENSKIMTFEVFFLGYITSLLSRDIEIITIVYTLLLTISLVIIVSYKKWSLIGIEGIFMTYFTYYALYFNNRTSISFSFANLFLITYFVAFTIQSIILSRAKEEKTKNIIMILLNSFFFYTLYLYQINNNYPNLKGAFTLALSIIYFVIYYFSKKDESISSTNLYLSLLYLTISIMIQLNKEWITVFLSLELLILSLIAIKTNIKELNICSQVLTAIIIIKTIFYDISLKAFSTEHFLESVRLISFLTTIITFYIIYFLLKDREEKEKVIIRMLYAYLAGFFLLLISIIEFYRYPLFLLSLLSAISLIYLIISNEKREEFAYKSIAVSISLIVLILNYTFSNKINKLDFNDFLSSTRLFAFLIVIATLYMIAYIYSFKKELSNNTKFVSSVYSWASAILVVTLIFLESSKLWTTFFLALFGIAVITVGFNIDRESLRIQGIITLFITIIKAFLYDTRNLSTIARTISFIILGIILIIASVLFSKYKDKVKEVL